MRCPIETQENAELLLAYCARRLDLETMHLLERHMHCCPACQAFREGQEAVWKALDSWEALPVSPDFDRRLYRRIDQEASSPWWSRFSRPLRPLLMRQGLPLAAAACLVMMAGIILERPAELSVPEPQAQVETVRAEQVENTLKDLEILRQLKLTPAAESKSVSSM